MRALLITSLVLAAAGGVLPARAAGAPPVANTLHLAVGAKPRPVGGPAGAPSEDPPAREQPVLSGFEKPTGKRFSGDFAETPVGDALRKVCEAAGLSVIFPPGMRGTVSGHFRNAPVEEVLRAILAQAGFTAERDGSILTVRRQEASAPAEASPTTKVAPGSPGASDQGGRRAKRKGARIDSDRVLQGDQVIAAGQRAGDVVVFAGKVRLQAGASAQQVTAIAGSVDVGPGANVDREVVAIGGDVHVAPGAHVGGDLVSVGGKVVVDEGAAVEGDQTSVSVPGLAGVLGGIVGSVAGGAKSESSPAWRLGSAVGEFVVFFLLGLLVFLLVPKRVENVTTSLVNRPMKAVLTGVLATIALPLVVLLLVVTVVGIPFVAILALGLAAAAVMGYTALALYVGRALPFRFERGAPILHLALGTAILVVLGQIPLLGCLAWIAGWLFVFGVVLRTRFGQPPTAPPAVYGTTAPPGPPAPPQPTGATNP